MPRRLLSDSLADSFSRNFSSSACCPFREGASAMTAQKTFSPWHKSEVVRAYIFVIKGRDVSGKIMRFIVRLKRIPRLFVVWHEKSSVEIILSELIIPFFDRFSRTKKCNQKHAEFISEFCVFLFALSIGRFRWILENILMRICL